MIQMPLDALRLPSYNGGAEDIIQSYAYRLQRSIVHAYGYILDPAVIRNGYMVSLRFDGSNDDPASSLRSRVQPRWVARQQRYRSIDFLL